MNDLQKQFQQQFPEAKITEDLSKYSTFQIGGPADFFYRLTDINQLPNLLRFATKNNLPHFIFGAGSNILFHKDGFRGLVVKVEAKNIKFHETEVTADAGVNIAALIAETVKHGLSGMEHWTGLPGTVGGAVRGNAGCHGLECKDILKSALLYNPKTDQLEEKPVTYFQYDYRHSILKESNEIVLKATFSLKKDHITKEEQQEIIAKGQNFRMTKQPFGKTTGSFFKNPSPDQPAGLLIDQAGLKGHSIGNAQISNQHANFFLNTGGATFDDIIALVKLAQEKVKEKFNIDLEPEVQIIGTTGPIPACDA